MMSNSDLSEPKRRAPGWMRILLGVSLALNLLVLGSVLGMALRLGGPKGPDGPPPRSIGSLLYRELPREDRRDLRAESRQILSASGSERGPSPEEELAVIDAGLRANPFDPAVIERVLEANGHRVFDQHKAFKSAWLDHVAGMSAAERADYADRLQEAFERRQERWHDRKARHEGRERDDKSDD